MEFSSILHTRVANQQQFGLCKAEINAILKFRCIILERFTRSNDVLEALITFGLIGITFIFLFCTDRLVCLNKSVNAASLQVNIYFYETKGVLTWYRYEFHSGTSSSRFLLIALYLFTWHRWKISYQYNSYRYEFIPAVVPDRNSHNGMKSYTGIM